jgi:hypothetical protein
VVVGGSRCGEVVLDGAVLQVWSNRPKRGWSRLSAVMRVEQGGAAVRDRRDCRGWSSKGCRGAPARTGARLGDGQAGWWPEEAALGRPGCGCQHWHGTRRNTEAGHERKTKVEKGELIGGVLPL